MTGLLTVATAAGETQDLYPLLTSVSRLLSYLGFVLVVGTTFFLAWLWPRASVEWVFIRLFYGGSLLLALATVATVVFDASGSFSDAFTGRSGNPSKKLSASDSTRCSTSRCASSAASCRSVSPMAASSPVRRRSARHSAEATTV